MMRFLILTILCSLWPAAAQTRCPDGRDLVPGNQRIVIDARSSTVLGGDNFNGCRAVEIVIYNKQPFLYKYKLDVAKETLTETSLSTFLPFFGPFVSEALTPPKDSKAAPSPVGDQAAKKTLEARLNDDPCKPFLEALLNAVGDARPEVDRLNTVAYGVIPSFNNRLQEFSGYTDILKQPGATCGSLQNTAASALKVELPSLGEVDAQSTVAMARLKRLRELLDEFDNPNRQGCRAEPAYLEALNFYNSAALIVVPAVRERIASLKQRGADVEKAKAGIQGVMDDPNAFFETRRIGPFRQATKVTVTFSAESLADGKKIDIAKQELTFGSRRFAIAGGFVVGFLQTREYQRVQSTRLGDDGKPLNAVGRQDSGNFRYLPMVFLHARLNERCAETHGNWYLTIGATAKPDNKGTSAEYLLGVSKSFVGHQVFVTGGVYVGRQQILQGGLTEGAIVPAAISELPISKEYTARFGMAISWTPMK